MSIPFKRAQPKIKNGDIRLVYIGLLCQVKTELKATREMMEDTEYHKMTMGKLMQFHLLKLCANEWMISFLLYVTGLERSIPMNLC